MIWLGRHGQTAMNAAGRYQGRIDSDLTAHGMVQAKTVGRLLADRVDRARCTILSSPLKRAVRTAEIVGAELGLAQRIDPRLVEVGMGDWEGLTADEIDAGWPGARAGALRNGWFFDAPGGERHTDVVARLTDMLADLKTQPGQDHIVICHAVTGRVLRGIWSDLPSARSFRLEIPQDAVFRLHGAGEIERVPALRDKFAGTQ